MVDHIVIERSGKSWAVKHNDSFLGLARSREAAAVVAQDLAQWIAARGGAPGLASPEPRAFAATADAQSPSAALAAATAAASAAGA